MDKRDNPPSVELSSLGIEEDSGFPYSESFDLNAFDAPEDPSTASRVCDRCIT